MIMIAIIALLLCCFNVVKAEAGMNDQRFRMSGNGLRHDFCNNDFVPPDQPFVNSTCPDWSLPAFPCINDDVTYSCNCSIPMNSWKETMFDCEAIVPTIGDPCSDTIPCVGLGAECIEGLCLCGPLYRYNYTIGDCEKVCTTVTDEFEETTPEYFYLNKHLPTAYNTNSYEECEQLCIDDDECLSFNLYNIKCLRFRYTFYMLADVSSELVLSTTTVRHGSRKCAYNYPIL